MVPFPAREIWSREWLAELDGWWEVKCQVPGAGRTLVKRALLSFPDAINVRILNRRDSRTKQTNNTVQLRGPMLEHLLKDIRFGLRTFAKKPGPIVVLLVTMAVGIGANTSIFTLLHSIVLKPLPYPDAEEIVQVWPTRSRGMSKAVYEWLQRNSDSYEWLAAWNESSFRRREDGSSSLVYGPMVTAEFFKVLGVEQYAGRSLQAGDDKYGTPVVWLSHAFWQREFGGDDVLGSTINLEGIERTIVGVMPAGMDLMQRDAEVIVPHVVEAQENDYSGNYLDVIARLKEGVTVEQADEELRMLAIRQAEETGSNMRWAETASVITLHKFVVGNVSPTLFLLAGAAAFTMLIVMVNVANLLLARALTREREISLRFALGASRGRVLKQLLTESVLLAAVGGAIGVVAAVVGVQSLVGVLPPDTPRLADVSISPAVLGFTTLLTLLTGLIAGIAPVANAFRTSLTSGIGAAGRGGTSVSKRRLRSMLVIGEMAMAVVLLAGAGVLVKSFWQTLKIDPGFEARGMIHLQVLPGAGEWESSEQLEQYYAGIRDDLRNLPGITAVSTVHAVPVVNTGWRSTIYRVGNAPSADDQPTLSNWRPVTPDYFATAGMTLVAGRPFDDGDVSGSEPVAIINQTAARTLFGDETPLGEQIVFRMEGSRPFRIVGVVKDVRIGGLQQLAPLATYRPFRQAGGALLTFRQQSRSIVLRSNLPTAQVSLMVRAAIRQIDPMANVVRVESMEETLSESLSEPRGVMILLVFFAATALLLGAVGIYGVMGYTVGERSRELSIRFALGASRGSVLSEVLLDGLKLSMTGLVAGGCLAVWLTRYLGSQLNGVSATDPIAFGFAGLLLLVVAMVAAYVPARRAATCDPMDAMRAE